MYVTGGAVVSRVRTRGSGLSVHPHYRIEFRGLCFDGMSLVLGGGGPSASGPDSLYHVAPNAVAASQTSSSSRGSPEKTGRTTQGSKSTRAKRAPVEAARQSPASRSKQQGLDMREAALLAARGSNSESKNSRLQLVATDAGCTCPLSDRVSHW